MPAAMMTTEMLSFKTFKAFNRCAPFKTLPRDNSGKVRYEGVIQITADFVSRFAGLGDVMRIYTDPAAFDEALASEIEKGKK
jgi:hypothetical protein